MKQTLALLALCTLTWNANTEPDLMGYGLFTSTVAGQYVQGPAWIGQGTSAQCEDLGLSADDLTHYFVVKAFDTAEQWSGASNEVSKLLASSTSPPPPPPLFCLKRNPKGKCVKWSQ